MITEAKRDLFVVDSTTIRRSGSEVIADAIDGSGRFVSKGTLDDIIFCLPRQLSDEEVDILHKSFDGEREALSELRPLGEKLLDEYLDIHLDEKLVLSVAVERSVLNWNGLKFLHREIGVWEKLDN